MLFRTMKMLTVGLTLSALVLPACVTQDKYLVLEDELARTQGSLARTNSDLAAAQDMLITAEGTQMEYEDRASLAEQLASENAELQVRIKELMEQNALVAPDGTVIVVHDGAYGWQTGSDLLFASGSDKLTKEGQRVLKEVAALLKQHDDKIIVEGHTDADPIKKTANLWPRGNVQLGAGRAMTVREFLIQQGINEARVGIASFGSFRPIAAGKTASAKAKNRRVEIMVQVPTKKT